MRKGIKEKAPTRHPYISPSIEIWQGPPAGESLLTNSLNPRDNYGGGGSGWGQGNMTGRSDYSSTGDGWGQGDMTGRTGYGSTSDGWGQGDVTGRNKYGSGGSGWE